MNDALSNCREVIENSLSYLMSKENAAQESIFNLDDVRINNDQTSKNKYKEAIKLTSSKPERKVVLFNSNIHKRDEVISFRVNVPNVEVVTSEGKLVNNIQISLVWPNTDGGYLRQDKYDNKIANADQLLFALNFDEASYELLFEASLPAFSATAFTIRKTAETTESSPRSANTSGGIPGSAYIGKVTFYYTTIIDDSIRNIRSSIEKRYVLNLKEMSA
jgi:hypothetical protein